MYPAEMLPLEGLLAGDRKDMDQADGTALDSLPRWLRDFIDLNNEMAGRETGRARRFLASSESDGPEAEKKKDEQRFNALLRLLQNPEYAQLYREAVDMVERMDVAAERAMRKLTREGEVAAERLDTLKENAAELPDGRKVFRSSDGRLIAEDGADVTDKKDSIKGLSPSTSSWEEFQRAREAADAIERQKREIKDYMQDVIDPARKRLADPEQPMTPDELREFLKQKDAAPAALRTEFDNLLKEKAEAKTAAPVNSAAADEYVGKAKLAGPDVFAQFKAKSAVVSDDAFAPPAPGTSVKPV